MPHADYLGSLTSKYRSDVKNRIFKKFEESGCGVERLIDVASAGELLHSLYLQVHGNATLRPLHLAGRVLGWACGSRRQQCHLSRRAPAIRN